jgi:O-antigen/teichoic acid export membrane protein
MAIKFVQSRLTWILQGQSSTAAAIQTLLSRVLILAVNLATGIITARSLGATGRGEQAAMVLWSMFLANTVTLGLPSAVIYNFKAHPQQKSELFTAALLLGTGLGLVASAMGVAFIPLWLSQYSPEVVRAAQWFMLNAPIVLLLLVSSYALEADGEFKLSNQIRCLIPAFTLVILVGLWLSGRLTPFTASLAYIINCVPIFIWMQVRLWQRFKPRWHRMGWATSRLIRYGIRAYGIDVLTTLAQQADQIFVVGLLSPQSMGMYAVALSISRMLNVFQTSIITVLFPKAAARPLSEVVSLIGQAARITTAITLIAGSFVMIVSPTLLHWLYGSEYIGATPVLRLLIVEVTLSGTTLVLAQSFMALSKPGIVTLLQSVGFGLTVPLLLFLIPRQGLTGAGIALLGSTAVRLLFILACYPMVLRVPPPSLLITRADLRLLRQMISQKL